MNFWGLVIGATVVSFLLTAAIRRYAVSHMLDIPNERSSHGTPTPRGGGLAILISSIACLLVARWQIPADSRLLAAVAGGGGLVGLIGLLDDHAHVPVGWRLLCHLVAAGAVIYLFADALHLLPLPSGVAIAFAAIYVVGMVNIYNFMDGIDGIASIEAITVCVGGVLLYGVSPVPGAAWVPLVVLLGASTGFLVWNFPRARIFMGDSGSGFLGLSFAALSLQAALFGPRYFWAWTILLGVFIVDASVTLARRFIRAERLTQAHRSHAYQRAAATYGSHARVSTVIACINLCWLLPIALLVGAEVVSSPLGVALAYTPLLVLALYFKAGARDPG